MVMKSQISQNCSFTTLQNCEFCKTSYSVGSQVYVILHEHQRGRGRDLVTDLEI